MTTFKERLLEIMKQRDMSQADVARKLNVSTATVSRYIKGDREPRFGDLHRIAMEFDVSDEWMMGYEVPAERKEHLIINDDEIALIREYRKLDQKKRIMLYGMCIGMNTENK